MDRASRPDAPRRRGASFFRGTPSELAQRLLGQVMVRQSSDGRQMSGIIVEVEAYLSSEDPSSHSARGKTNRNASMFLAAGSLYVYSIHSRYCLNIVSEGAGMGSAVLVRALEPWTGIPQLAANRGLASPCEADVSVADTAWLRSLTSGPGRLCQALAVNRALDGVDLTSDPSIWLEPAPASIAARDWRLRSTPRIGISRARELSLRWFIDGHQLVSGPAREHSQGRLWRFGG